MKGRAGPEFALDPDAPPHEFSQGTASVQAETRAAVCAARRGVDLVKPVEHPVEGLGRNADAGVADGEVDVHRTRTACGQRSRDGHATLARELDGVADQVREHRTKPWSVTHGHRGNALIDVHRQAQSLLERVHAHRCGDALRHVGHEAAFPGNRQLARLDLGEVQHLAHVVRELMQARPLRAQQLALLGRLGDLTRGDQPFVRAQQLLAFELRRRVIGHGVLRPDERRERERREQARRACCS